MNQLNIEPSNTETLPSNPVAAPALSPDVVRRAQQGDPDAFAIIFQAHKSRIYSLCLRMTNNSAEAEDLAQDAFVQVFRKLATFRGDSALSTWLYRIAVNTVLMHFRKKSPARISLDEPYANHSEDGKQVSREYGTRDDRLVGCVSRVALTRAISELPQGCRTIFLLHEIEGYEHREIAKLLGCSVGNSKSQLHKARLRIREFLTSTEDNRKAPVAVMAEAAPARVRTQTSRAANSVARWKIPVPAVPGMGGMVLAESNA